MDKLWRVQSALLHSTVGQCLHPAFGTSEYVNYTYGGKQRNGI